jgi:hypothetical protein
LEGFLGKDDASVVYSVPTIRLGEKLTLQVWHFSIAGVTNEDLIQPSTDWDSLQGAAHALLQVSKVCLSGSADAACIEWQDNFTSLMQDYFIHQIQPRINGAATLEQLTALESEFLEWLQLAELSFNFSTLKEQFSDAISGGKSALAAAAQRLVARLDACQPDQRREMAPLQAVARRYGVDLALSPCTRYYQGAVNSGTQFRMCPGSSWYSAWWGTLSIRVSDPGGDYAYLTADFLPKYLPPVACGCVEGKCPDPICFVQAPPAMDRLPGTAGFPFPWRPWLPVTLSGSRLTGSRVYAFGYLGDVGSYAGQYISWIHSFEAEVTDDWIIGTWVDTSAPTLCTPLTISFAIPRVRCQADGKLCTRDELVQIEGQNPNAEPLFQCQHTKDDSLVPPQWSLSDCGRAECRDGEETGFVDDTEIPPLDLESDPCDCNGPQICLGGDPVHPFDKTETPKDPSQICCTGETWPRYNADGTENVCDGEGWDEHLVTR